MSAHKRLRLIAGLLATLLLAASIAACGDDDEADTRSVSEVESPTEAGSVSEADETPAGSVSGSDDGVSSSGGAYTPVSNVDSHLNVALDMRDIGALLDASPVDYAAIAAIYSDGKNAVNSDGSFRTLKGFATDEERAAEFADAAAFYGSPTFLDDEVTAAIEGSGDAAGWSDGQRKQAINKGMLRILYHWVLTELPAAVEKTEAGDIDPAEGAPHNWDEAWAFYVGAPDGTGARPYAIQGTALKREADHAKTGLIDQPLIDALVNGLEEIEEGNAEEVAEAAETIESRMNAVFYIGAARYFHNAMKSSETGDAAATAIALTEGLAFYRTIQPVVAAADSAADEAIVAFFSRDPSATITVAERDAGLAAINASAVTAALNLEVTDLLTASSFQ